MKPTALAAIVICSLVAFACDKRSRRSTVRRGSFTAVRSNASIAGSTEASAGNPVFTSITRVWLAVGGPRPRKGRLSVPLSLGAMKIALGL